MCARGRVRCLGSPCSLNMFTVCVPERGCAAAMQHVVIATSYKRKCRRDSGLLAVFRLAGNNSFFWHEEKVRFETGSPPFHQVFSRCSVEIMSVTTPACARIGCGRCLEVLCMKVACALKRYVCRKCPHIQQHRRLPAHLPSRSVALVCLLMPALALCSKGISLARPWSSAS